MFKKMFIYFLYYEDNVIYIGSTKDFKKRMRDHKSNLKRKKLKLYEFMRDKNLSFEDLKTYNFETNLQTKFELMYLEGIYIRLFKPICNVEIAGRSKKEYKNENKKKINEYHREYQKNNKDQINEYHREYQKKNKEQISEKERDRNRQKNTINCIRYLFKK